MFSSYFLSVKSTVLLRQYCAILLIRFFISIGFAMCSFIPAFFESCISSAKALAVIAKIGIVLASGLSKWRIFLVAVNPSMTGIIRSIRIRSKVPGGFFEKSFSACAPFPASVTSMCSSSYVFPDFILSPSSDQSFCRFGRIRNLFFTV